MAKTENTADKVEQTPTTKSETPKRIKVRAKNGAIARPLEQHLDAWIDAGWKKV